MLRRVKREWGNVNREGKEKLRKRICVAKEPYNQWVKERERQIKLPCNYEVPLLAHIPELTHMLIQEEEALKATITKLVKENEGLSQKLYKVTLEMNDFKFGLAQREKELVESQGTASYEAGKIQRVKYGLNTLCIELRKRNKELWRVIKANKYLEPWWDKSFEQRKLMKESFEARIENLTRSHQEAQAHVMQETHHREEMERTYPPGILEVVK